MKVKIIEGDINRAFTSTQYQSEQEAVGKAWALRV